MLLLTALTWTAESGSNESGNAAPENRVKATIRVVDQHGRQFPVESQTLGARFLM